MLIVEMMVLSWWVEEDSGGGAKIWWAVVAGLVVDSLRLEPVERWGVTAALLWGLSLVTGGLRRFLGKQGWWWLVAGGVWSGVLRWWGGSLTWVGVVGDVAVLGVLIWLGRRNKKDKDGGIYLR